MPRLDRIHLINAAGFDEIEFPVGGHCQVIGVNGHGKSTLLRTILFFYLGTNEKSSYGLHETKSDFVSHYLGDPPSYLVYEVARGEGRPAYHIAVTRPAGRIQFHFVDASFRRDYYVDGNVVLPIGSVQERWRDAKCAFDTLSSYEDFTHRIYGIVSSTYAVFRPAARTSGQVSVLPRIISGIFTVSQLEADKLKSALTCGVRSDARVAELDLVQLKNQLENFRRVNRAVKTYVRHEQDAVDLVELAACFEAIKTERQQAIESLVRAAKLLPEETCRIEEQRRILQREEEATEAEHKQENDRLNEAIATLGNELAELNSKIKQGTQYCAEYEEKHIEGKSNELDSLPALEAEKLLGERQYASLTAEYADENQRKDQLLANVRQTWAELSSNFHQRRAAIEKRFRRAFEELDAAREGARAKIAQERAGIVDSLVPKRTRLGNERVSLNDEFKTFAEITPPAEIAETERGLRRAERSQADESSKQQQLRSELQLTKEKAKAESEKLERDAASGRARIETGIATLETEGSRVTEELEMFDASLARFFQAKAPTAWRDAAKTLSRDILFRDARELEAKISPAASHIAWGVEISTAQLPDLTESYDRARLTLAVREIRKKLATEKDALQAAQMRYLAEFDSQQKRSMQAENDLAGKIAACGDACASLGDECIRLDNALLNLQSQFNASKQRRLEELDARESEWKLADELLRKEESQIEHRFRTLLTESDAAFEDRRCKVTKDEEVESAAIETDEGQATKKRDAEVARIEQDSQQALVKKGANAERIAAARKRVAEVEKQVQRISKFREEVAEYRRKKVEWIERLPAWELERKSTEEFLAAKKAALHQLDESHRALVSGHRDRRAKLDQASDALRKDEEAVARFRADTRFLQEWGYFDRADLSAASFHQPGVVDEFLAAGQAAHQDREEVGKKGDKNAKAFLNRFDAETLDRKLLGFSPIHEYFEWFIFVGSELKPFVNHRAITGMKRIQTQEFEQLIRNICHKNAAFHDGIHQVKQTAASVQTHLANNNFVDVLEAIELKVERVDNQLTRTLEDMESFAGLSFSHDHDLFGKRADRAEIDSAIGHFERLVREIDSYRDKQLLLTDYFDFLIRVRENGHDMGWRKSLNDIGSTGTDYLLKMLIYLSLIEVYRARAIDPKFQSTVHCVLDETGVLAPKYLRSVLAYAAARGIILITAGHSQQTSGFDQWVLVRKHGQRFGGQTVLRKILKCD